MNAAPGRHIVLDGSTVRPAPYNGWGAEIVRWISTAYLKLNGWRIRGDWPGFDKAVLVAAPHTSNWDGLNMLATAGYYRVKLKWMGKKSLTTGPFGWVLKAMGCVPIDRSASHDVVKAMSEVFAREKRMILAVPPEGTRSAVREWKSGFYHIAMAANVPLVLSVLDYGTKTVSLAATFAPGGDYDADLAIIRAHYADAVGKKAANFVS